MSNTKTWLCKYQDQDKQIQIFAYTCNSQCALEDVYEYCFEWCKNHQYELLVVGT